MPFTTLILGTKVPQSLLFSYPFLYDARVGETGRDKATKQAA
jgi:hypothetical protein